MDRLVQALGEPQQEMVSELVLFSPERRKEALEFAKAKRAEGKIVTIQDMNAVQDVDAFTETFSEVHFFVGNGGSKQ